jgi:hypothetical protein
MLAHAPFSVASVSDPLRIIAAVGEKHRSRLQARQELSGDTVVVRLTGRQREPNRQPIRIASEACRATIDFIC